LAPTDVESGPIEASVEISDAAVPELNVDEAIERLDAAKEPFVFFADPATGRGNVLYRRYDGHYGLVTPQ